MIGFRVQLYIQIVNGVVNEHIAEKELLVAYVFWIRLNGKRSSCCEFGRVCYKLEAIESRESIALGGLGLQSEWIVGLWVLSKFSKLSFS